MKLTFVHCEHSSFSGPIEAVIFNWRKGPVDGSQIILRYLDTLNLANSPFVSRVLIIR